MMDCTCFKDGMEYRFSVRAAPRDRTGKEWIPTASVKILRGETLDAKSFVDLGEKTYPTQEEAISAGCETAKRLVEAGKVK